MKEKNSYSRRRFLSTSAITFAAAEFIGLSIISSKGLSNETVAKPQKKAPFLIANKKIDAGVLSIAYAELGPRTGQPILLLHGWPYDIDSYSDVADMLAEKGYRVLVPYTRGHGETRFISTRTMRNGQQSALAPDVISFLDAVKINSAVIAGYDWGARTANIVAALWPNRCKALVSVSGYLIGSRAVTTKPLHPTKEHSWWYMFYFSTKRGRDGYNANRKDFAKLIWQSASPEWAFDEPTFQRSMKALENPDHVAVVIHNYRWRITEAEGEAKYQKFEEQLAKLPAINVPTITIEGDRNGAPHPAPADYARKFTGKYIHLTFTGGIGHNPPQEAPDKFYDAILQAIELSEES